MQDLTRTPIWCVLPIVVVAGGAAAVDLNAILCEPAGWTLNSRYACVKLQTEQVHGNGPGLLFEYTRDSVHLHNADGSFNNQAYRPTARRELPTLDLSGFNRLSFWLIAYGNAEEAFQWGFTANKPFRFSCRRGEWHHARCDLREAGADLSAITQILIAGVNQGTAPGDPKKARIFLSDFRLGSVPDSCHIGWTPAESEIVAPYTGICPGEDVIALAAPCHGGKTFRLTGPSHTSEGRVSTIRRTRRTEYAELRFRAPETQATYRLVIADGPSTDITVMAHPYAELKHNALRVIRAMRCGCATELHAACHLDDGIDAATGEHVDVCGGWHDEGVSQFPHLTYRTVAALARYCRNRSADKNDTMTAGLLDEVEWGTRSILKYEVRPGWYLHSWASPQWFYTDNRPGSGTDRKLNITQPHQLTCWWLSEAYALCAQVCREPLRSKARAAAERLWRLHRTVEQTYAAKDLARWNSDRFDLRVAAAHLGASVEMFRLTGEKAYVGDAVRQARHVLRFQHNPGTAGGAGLSRFFRRRFDPSEPYVGAGPGDTKSQDLPGRPLADLLFVFPQHDDAPLWREALRAYAEGTLKPLARHNAPYGYVASGPYLNPKAEGVEADTVGDMLVYPLQFTARKTKKRLVLRSADARSQLNRATQLAAVGQAINDPELLQMAHGALGYLFGMNPAHVSVMRGFGTHCPDQAQNPNVPGFMILSFGMTAEGLPYWNPAGGCRMLGPDRFIVKEGNTALCAELLEACAYLALE